MFTLLPYEYEWTWVACGYNVINRNSVSRKNQQKNWTLSIQ